MIHFNSGRPKRGAERTPKHLEYLPGLLIVRIKEDVVAGMPEARAAAVATAKAFRLPSAIEQPFRPMISKRLLREVIPVFARAAKGRPRALSGKLAGRAFATSVRESDADDLRGINLLRVFPFRRPGAN